MAITREIVAQLFPRAPQPYADAFAAQADGLFATYGISENNTRLCDFLAQVGHESGGLTVMTENLNYSAERLCQVWPSRFPTPEAARPYAGNPEALANNVYGKRLGNSDPGDGWRYRGRGFIQITGRENYTKLATSSGLDLVDDPDLASTPENALTVVCAFWKWKDVNSLCDKGTFEDVTKRINGGLVGINERRAWLSKVQRLLAAPIPAARQPDAAVAITVQRALLARGYREVGAPDGLIGPHSLAAIGRFRRDQGLPPGGVDGQLLAALGLSDYSA